MKKHKNNTLYSHYIKKRLCKQGRFFYTQHMTKQIKKNAWLCIIYYDGQCPFCYRYADYLFLKKEYNLELRDARTHTKDVQQLSRIWHNINEWIIVIHIWTTYQWIEGIIYIHALIRWTPKSLHPRIVSLGKFFYQTINAIRKWMLYMQWKKDIITTKNKHYV